MTNTKDMPPPTALANKIVFINHRRTSMRLCRMEWNLIDKICKIENISRNDLVELLETNNQSGLGLTYFTRLFIMLYFYEKSPFGIIKTRRHGIGCQSYIYEILSKISVLSLK